MFDSGPSLLSGMSQLGTNPLRQLMDAVGVAEEVQWATYDGWMVREEVFLNDDLMLIKLTHASNNHKTTSGTRHSLSNR